ncbi:MAG: VWA domain-containing protein, partial [Robiginitomaculum sp.]|nr:VWA domain-containing protein [Robiginitomaculum sp.]
MPLSKLITASTLALICAFSPAMVNAQNAKLTPVHKIMPRQARIQIALLLDTSNSMDGLISQAKSQLWTLVNELSEGKKYGRSPLIEIALYEYGNSNISVSKGYVRQVLSLTTDLDDVSEKLFSLTTNGGQEYAGKVIMTSLEELEWSKREDDMKLIIIAGNEPFTQGPVKYEEACGRARRGGIIIDTIHCGDEQVGINTKWKDGADCAGGIYMTINQDEKMVHIPSPYDDDIIRLNKKLNDTYFGYGSRGAEYKNRQTVQDQNAAGMSVKSILQRSKSKSSSAYSNEAWDVVDAYKKDKSRILELEEAQLPKELQGKSEAERKVFIESKISER